MNDILKNIFDRRAVRRYKDMPVPNELIGILLDAGRMAPSAMNKQPWKFYILTDTHKIKAFSKQVTEVALREAKHISLKEAAKLTLSFFHLSSIAGLLKNDDHIFYGAPVVIFITTPVSETWGALDAGMCAQNIMLAAKALGLDSCPVGLGRYVAQTKDFYKLNIPGTEQIQLAIVIGYGDEQPRQHERREDNVIYI